MEIFYTLKEAQILIEHWRRYYNTERPHSSLGYQPPAPEATLPSQKRLAYAVRQASHQPSAVLVPCQALTMALDHPNNPGHF